MQFVTKPILAAVLNQLDDRFDAHQVEKRVLRLFPIDFAQELQQYRQSQDPLRQFSSVFAKLIDSSFTRQIQKTQKVVSSNLGGEDCENQQWQKLVPTIT